jgi:hypothetical protein
MYTRIVQKLHTLLHYIMELGNKFEICFSYDQKRERYFKDLISSVNEIGENFHADIQPPWWWKISRIFNQLVKHVKYFIIAQLKKIKQVKNNSQWTYYDFLWYIIFLPEWKS